MADLNKIREELAELKRQAQEKEQEIEKALEATLHDLAAKFSEMATQAGFTGETADFADILKGRKVEPKPKGKRKEEDKYMDDDGNIFQRKPRLISKEDWENGLKKQYEQNYKKKFGKK